MKKALFFAVFALVSFAFGADTTKILFSRSQFQTHQATEPGLALTVPLVYKGTLSFERNNADIEEDICVVTTKSPSFEAYMTICQPCIDCFPCEEIQSENADEPLPFDVYGEEAVAGKITRWNLYIVKVDKKNKTTTINKIDLIGDAGETAFFTGLAKAGSNGQVQRKEGAGLIMTGGKSDYKFSYIDAVYDGEWTIVGNKTLTAYIKSFSKLAGYVAMSEYAEGYADAVMAKVSLTRNTSLTNQAVKETFGTVVKKNGKNWADCSVVTEAHVCEEYLSEDSELNLFDQYLIEQYGKKIKGGDVELNDEFTLEDIETL